MLSYFFSLRHNTKHLQLKGEVFMANVSDHSQLAPKQDGVAVGHSNGEVFIA